jgi:hypothetical protein
VLRPKDLTIPGLWGQVADALFSMDGRYPRTIRLLVTQPGALTLAYLHGQRKALAAPVQLFLLANVLFFALQSATDTRIFSQPLESHQGHEIWGSVAGPMIERHLAARGISQEAYAPVFNQAVGVNAKSLVILMVLPFALLPPILFHRRNHPAVAHIVFSLHFYAFLLLLFCVSIVVAFVDLQAGGLGLDSPGVDTVLSIAEVAICAVYLFFATGKVYGVRGVGRVLRLVPLVTAAIVIMLAYRFVLLPITLLGT